MKLAPDWQVILQRAWSIRLMLIAAVLSGLEVVLPLLQGFISLPPGIFAALSGLTVSAAFVARLVAQKGISDADQ